MASARPNGAAKDSLIYLTLILVVIGLDESCDRWDQESGSSQVHSCYGVTTATRSRAKSVPLGARTRGMATVT